MKQTENIEQDLSINESALGKECLSQASLYYSYANSLAQVKSEVQKSSDALALVKAELDRECRDILELNNIKITEAAVAAEVIKHKKYQSALNNLRDLEEAREIYEVAVKAFTQRKDMLDNLVRLEVSGLYTIGARDTLRNRLNSNESVSM